MDLKKVDLYKLQDYAFTPNEIAMSPMTSWNSKFINIKCLDNEDLVPTVQAIPLAKVKQAREEIENMDLDDYLEILQEIGCTSEEVRVSRKFAVTVLGKLIAESEG